MAPDASPLVILLGVVSLATGLAVGAIAVLQHNAVDLRRRLRWLERAFEDGGEDEEGGLQSTLAGGFDYLARRLWRLSFVSAKQQEALRSLLLHAGIRRPDGLRLLIAVKLLAMMTVGPLTAAALILLGVIQSDFAPTGLAVLGGALAGGLAPEYVLHDRAKTRQRKIRQRLPDALDLLIIFANAGYGLDMAIQRLATDLARSAPELSDEFAVTSNELRILSDRDQALANLAARTGLEPIRTLVSTMSQTQKYGTPLSQALRVLAMEQRNKAIVEMEERAARLPVLITMPLILLILPAVLIIAGTPGVLQASKAWSGSIESGADHPQRK
jgi:tight adherence protein C